MQIVCGDLFAFRPSGKGSRDASLLAYRAFGVTGSAKVLEARTNS